MLLHCVCACTHIRAFMMADSSLTMSASLLSTSTSCPNPARVSFRPSAAAHDVLRGFPAANCGSLLGCCTAASQQLQLLRLRITPRNRSRSNRCPCVCCSRPIFSPGVDNDRLTAYKSHAGIRFAASAPRSAAGGARAGGETAQASPSASSCAKGTHACSHPRSGTSLERGQMSQTPSAAGSSSSSISTAGGASSSSLAGGEVLIRGEGLSKTHDGLQILFEGLDVTVAAGQRVGLLGANGSGKSTLLRILAGEETADKGLVQRKRGLRIGYLPQDPDVDGSLTVLDAVLAAPTPAMAAVREYERALAALDGRMGDQKGAKDSANERLQKAMERVDAMGAWDMASEAERLLGLLGVGFADRKVWELSGGQKKRVALAATLLSRPDLLILDEPTNHMDVAVIEWMEATLATPGLTVLLVTHDRYFLDRVCNEILELDRGRAFWHTGNYSAFLANRAARESAEAAVVGRAATVLRKEAEWMRRQPKARSTKSRARIDRFYALTKVVEGQRRPPPALQLGMGESRLGSKVMVMDSATAARGENTVFESFSYEFGRGERIGVVGRNGVGKTTFLDALAGVLPLKEGVREVGETVVIGYYTQHSPPIPPNVRIIDFVRGAVDRAEAPTLLGNTAATTTGASSTGGAAGGDAAYQVVGTSSSSNSSSDRGPPMAAEFLLEQFGFPRAKQFARAVSLSGGEKRRLFLATVLLQRPNFLMLDEPTNDLDLPTIHVLEKFLDSYEGCVVVASHDRSFMDNVVARQFVLEGDGEVQLYDGLYSEYLEDAKERGSAAQSAKAAAVAAEQQQKKAVSGSAAGLSAAAGQSRPPGKKSARRLSYMERKEYERLEGEIDRLTKQQESVEKKLEVAAAAGENGFGSIAELSEKLAEIVAEIDKKTDRWLELAEIDG